MLFERPEIGDGAVILHVELDAKTNPEQEEFVELARSAELTVAACIVARRAAPHAKWFIGTGKLTEVADVLRQNQAHLLLINHDLSAGQQRNLERHLDCRVMTRTELILMIFADRALSHEGQLQVELAQLKHAQTRLVRGWTHLDRQKGGIGLRGAGEKQIELDQRMLGERIKQTQARLATVQNRRAQSRRGRHRRGTPTIALVGYTNAGKSTLFNRLTQAGVVARDQLFATLDPTLRKITLPGLGTAVLADTVGFVSLLPHSLIDAFKATLEEVVHADLLLHVVDASDELAEERQQQVREVLADIGAQQVPELLIYNKADIAAPGSAGSNGLAVSALTGSGIDTLVARLAQLLGVVAPHEVLLDPADGSTRAMLYRSGAVLSEQTTEDGRLQLTVQANAQLLERLQASNQVILRATPSPP